MNTPMPSRRVARRIIESVGGSGTPPDYGFQYFTAGIEEYMDVIEEEYLADYIADGGSSFKMVVGTYGGGKTHFLYSVRELAWQHNFAVSYIALSPEETPFHRLELVYRTITLNIMHPMNEEEMLSGHEGGIKNMVRAWYFDKLTEFQNLGLSGNDLNEELREYASGIRGFESISFGRAVQSAFLALLERRDDDFDTVMGWLQGEAYDRRVHGRFGILQRIDRSAAFSIIRSLIQWAKFIGHTGLVILMDEAERVPSLATRQRDLLLNNLRALIDECAQANFKHAFFLYAVTDENFLEGNTGTYEALRQRLSTTFDLINTYGVKILLDNTGEDPIATLKSIGQKLSRIYEIAYRTQLDRTHVDNTIEAIAQAAHHQRFFESGYKRLFVQSFINALQLLHRRGGPINLADVGLESV